MEPKEIETSRTSEAWSIVLLYDFFPIVKPGQLSASCTFTTSIRPTASFGLGFIRLRIVFLILLIDPGVSHIGYLCYQRKFIATERGTGFPALFGLVYACEGNTKSNTWKPFRTDSNLA